MADLSSLMANWPDPPAIYRGAAFWSWNARLDSGRLVRQIDSMKRARMGGFFMHSRYGLRTPYLSDEWFECVRVCVGRARELGMKAYIYDEDRWPSGYAGGMVTRTNPRFRLHYLAGSLDTPSAGEQRVAEFRVELDDHGWLRSYERVTGSAAVQDPARLLTFGMHLQEPPARTNDGGDLDALNPEAVAEFIRVTHEAYAQRFQADMPDVIPAIFTDEPSFGAQIYAFSERERRVPWTPRLPDEFLERWGYDVRDHLPELVFPLQGDEFSQVCHDYHRTLGELFVEACTAQMGAWCAQHGIALTGHMLAEPSLTSQSGSCGAVMPNYEWMDWPGLDMLGDRVRELATVKQCTSAGAQLGKERVLSELYGCTGWDWPLEGHKFMGDWHWVGGVNFQCPHLTHYSLAGGGKRDFPASIGDHSPWWKYYGLVEDYFGRLSAMLSAGTPVRDVLVIHPVASAWGHMPISKLGERGPADELDDQLRAIIYALSEQHYDWDFGDETLLERHGSVVGSVLGVGQMQYSAVIVPPCVTLSASTLRLLVEFLEGGGSLLLAGSGPTHVDGAPGAEARELASRARTCDADPAEVISALEDMLPRRVSLTENGEEAEFVYALLTRIEGAHLLFIQSHDRKQAHEITVRVRADGDLVRWDAVTGRQYRVDARPADGGVAFQVHLHPTGSALLSIGPEMPDAVSPPPKPEIVGTREVSGPFRTELTEGNSMPLDYCRYRVGEGSFSEPVPVLKADEKIRARYGLSKRWGGDEQPWYLYETGAVDTSPRERWQLLWSFHVTTVPRDCRLALESPGDFRIDVNGREVSASEADGWWIDEDIETIPITQYLQTGENRITLSFDYRAEMEIEPLYLVGDFGVRTRDGGAPAPDNLTIVDAPAEMPLGSWVGNGLDFYGAAVRYKLSVKRPGEDRRCLISLQGIECTAAAIHVGDRTFVLPWEPFSADITDALSSGQNEVAIEVIGGRRNILGPLHTPADHGVGPPDFDPDNERWCHEYRLTDHGIMKPVLVQTATKGE